MTGETITFTGGLIFDGADLQADSAARFVDGAFSGLLAREEVCKNENTVNLDGDILAPGFVDLQVNGGGGVMLNDDPSVQNIKTMAMAHRKLGTAFFLPTLITDDVEKTRAAIAAAIAAVDQNVVGVAGLHLEGPHLSLARKGAHDASLIRPMNEVDLLALLEAAQKLPILKVTVAPENVSVDQVRTLADAGVLVSLGHTDASYETCQAYAEAGAICATHLFNAMSQLGNRTPGLVGAVLDSPALSAGLIADGVHVHPAAMRTALRAKSAPGQIFLVTDAMAVAGTDLKEFSLGGRRILRQKGELRLEDGTLAGADLDMLTAVRVLTGMCDVPLAKALAAATTVPAGLCGWSNYGFRHPGYQLRDAILISSTLETVTPAR